MQEDSQKDLRMAVPTTTTTTIITTTLGDPQPEAAFTTETFTTSLLNPGDEFENAQIEKAAEEHLHTARDLTVSVAALNHSVTAMQEANDQLNNDPNLIRSRKHIAEMRGAIHDWAVRRWANLKRLSTGDASAFQDGPAPPPGIA